MSKPIDIDFSLKQHPLTGDIAVKSNIVSAVEQSLINICLTNYYERGFNIEIAGNLDYSIFEQLSSQTLAQIKKNVSNAIENFEPRVELIQALVQETNNNSIKITIIYNIINDPTERSVDVNVDRLR